MKSTTAPAQDHSVFVLSRVVNAPRDRVWKAWTDENELKHWFGPKGIAVMHSKIDLRPGGTYHYGMRTPEGMEMWGKWTFREIQAPEKLVFIVSFSDKDQGVTRHPLNPCWPREMLSTIGFADQGDKTKITIEWTPYDATAEESKTFAENHASMQQGWGGTMEQFEAYLAKA